MSTRGAALPWLTTTGVPKASAVLPWASVTRSTGW